MEVVEDRARQQFSERAGVADVCPTECVQVSGSLPLVDDRRRVAETDEDQVEHETPGPAVAVEERVDSLELGVEVGESRLVARP